MKSFLFVLSIGLLPVALAAQFSFGMVGGVSNYQGDLAKNFANMNEMHGAFGGGIGYKINPYFDVKAQLISTKLTGDDANYPDDASRATRRFKFESSITELAALLEYNVFGSSSRTNTGVFTPKFTPVIYGGFGVTKISNEAECLSADCLSGAALSPFPEEDAKSALFTFPFGVGIKYDVSPLLAVGLRGGYRYSFSDYLDGVSKTANEDRNDWYFILGANVVFYIQQKDDGAF